MSRRTPQGLQHALNELARRHGVAGDQVLRRFLFARLLARVFHDDPSGWLLKGGQALLVRFHAARFTRDIDLYRISAATLDEAVDALTRAARLDLDDLVHFEMRGRLDRLEERGVARLIFDAYLGSRRKDSVSVDLVVDSRPIGLPECRQLEPPVPLDWPDSWPHVLLYPLVDHVADKIAAMYERHGDARLTSTRYRDLVDLVLIALREPLDGRQLCDALRSEIDRRAGQGSPLVVPAHFVMPAADWVGGYHKAAARVPGLEVYRTLDQASELAHALLDPVFDGRARLMTWMPERLGWVDQPGSTA
jgi:Nucleotidyl transferase AbiEii toxin, Type IV TA system